MRSGRDDLGGEQTWRPEHYGISAISKHGPCEESYFVGQTREADPTFAWGRPTPPGKKQVRAHGGTAGIRDPASKERFSEITSGSSRGQQGLSTTCKDSPNEARNRSSAMTEQEARLGANQDGGGCIWTSV